MSTDNFSYILTQIGFGVLWQSLVLAGLVYILLARLPREQIRIRYHIALGGLFGTCLLLAFPFLPSFSNFLGLPAGELAMNPDFTNSGLAYSAPAPFTFEQSNIDANFQSGGIANNISIFTILTGIWLMGSLLALIRILAAFWHGLSFVKSFVAAETYGVSHLSRPTQIVYSSQINAPMVFGFHRPKILVPTDFTLNLDDAKTRVVLEHEIAHIVRNDIWVNLGQRVVLAVLWWCMPLYWLNRHVGIERENLCDEMAAHNAAANSSSHVNLQTDSMKRMLAGALIDFAERKTTTTSPSLAIGLGSGLGPHGKILARRILRLCTANSNLKLSKQTLLSTSIALPLTLIAMSIVTPRTVTAHPPNTPNSTTMRGIDDNIERQLAHAGYSSGQSALYYMVRQGEARAVNDLVQAKSLSTNFIIPGEGTPLIEAVRRNDLTMLNILLAAGAQPDLISSGDGTALIVAAQLGYDALVKRLIPAGADVNLSSPGDGNPLIAAALGGRLETAKMLLKHGADINAQVQGDETPLINAAQAGHLSLVKLFLDSGADINLGMWADSHDGRIWRTPLSEATARGHKNVAKLLKSKGAKIITKTLPAGTHKIVTGRITSHYGLSRPRFNGKVHMGLDITNKLGSPIYTPRDAKIIAATDLYNDNPKWGKVVVIQSEGGVQTLFAHLQSYEVSVGQTIKAGTHIASIGNTGQTTGPHVHIETMVNGDHVDPLTVWRSLNNP